MSSLGPAGPGGDPTGVDALCLFASASGWPQGGQGAQFLGSHPAEPRCSTPNPVGVQSAPWWQHPAFPELLAPGIRSSSVATEPGFGF